jgi:hypothetical protein
VAKGDIDTLVLGSANTCWRDPIDLPTLLSLLQMREDPGRWIGPVAQLFSDVPLSALKRFAERHQLSRSDLSAYFALYMGQRGDANPEVEAWLDG